MNKTQKVDLGNDLKDKFQKANVMIFADYKGLSATQADMLRKLLRAEKAEVKVLKNNVARKVAASPEFSDDTRAVMESNVGPTLVAFGYGDTAATAKIIHKFSKDYEALKLKDSLMDGKMIRPADVEALAKLPPRNVLLGQLLGTMNGPIRGFVTVLSAVPRGLVTVLAAIEKQKSESA